MAALSEFLSRLYTITIVFFCLLLLEALILFRSVTGTISNYNPTKRVISTTKYLQLIEEKNPTILYTDKLRQQSATECAVCLSEFSEGEYVRRTKVLPDQIVADFHRLQDNQSINQYYYYDGSDEEMIFLLSALHGNGLHRIF
ncbi:conserved hypothetical protein [Ricinus communis]|uniref:Uncharacterized protein n=1 Tax=Ricinus communis TaxID=3988 RepID=B9SRK0_RICCO|nr:conserved hypothetical protein [Ricinus communis]